MAKNAKQTNGLIIAVVTVLMAVALIVGSSLTTGYLITGTANVREWQKITQVPAPGISGAPDGSDVQGVGNNMIINSGEEYGISLTSELIAPDDYDNYGISTQAETAYTFVGTAYDENGSSNGVPQDMEATANWKNASSSWASGKNVEQYIKVTKTGANQFQVSCLQGFGEPAILTIKSAHSTASATKQFDYVKRVSDVHLTIADNFLDIDACLDVTNTEIVYGVGTVVGDVYLDTAHYSLSSALCQATIQSTYYTYFVQQCNNAGLDMDWSGDFSENLGGVKVENNKSYEYLLEPLADLMFNMTDNEIKSLNSVTNGCKYFSYAMQDALNKMPNRNQGELYLDWHYTYGGQEYSRNQSEVTGLRVGCNWAGSIPKITSVTINGNSNYVF